MHWQPECSCGTLRGVGQAHLSVFRARLIDIFRVFAQAVCLHVTIQSLPNLLLQLLCVVSSALLQLQVLVPAQRLSIGSQCIICTEQARCNADVAHKGSKAPSCEQT